MATALRGVRGRVEVRLCLSVFQLQERVPCAHVAAV